MTASRSIRSLLIGLFPLGLPGYRQAESAPPLAPLRPSSTLTADEVTAARANYSKALEILEIDRAALGEALREASGAAQRSAVLAQARYRFFKAMVTDIFPAWEGTTWDFNGITQIPGEGRIACGYFVTTTLAHAGVRLPRVRLAQQPSSRIIKTLVSEDAKGDISVSAGRPVAEIIEQIKAAGPGLYVVGLDTHTGFVCHDGETLLFIHSSYYRPPFCVVAEPIVGKNPLADSNYRMIGKILDDGMMRKWLLGEEFVL